MFWETGNNSLEQMIHSQVGNFPAQVHKKSMLGPTLFNKPMNDLNK